jgi:hypothetical protein
MRFVLTIDNALALAGLVFVSAISWRVGCWIADKLLGFIRK